MSPPSLEALRSLPRGKALCQLIAWLGEDAPPQGVYAAIDEHLARPVGEAPAAAARALWERTERRLTRALCAKILTVAELGPEALGARYAHPRALAIADAWWQGDVAVRVVRAAASDDAVSPDASGVPADLVVPTVCAACGDGAAALIDCTYGFLPGDYLSFELRCDACGRYSDYTLED